MKRLLILAVLSAATLLTACEKDYGVFNSDNIPLVPVTFPNATTYGFEPFISVSVNGDSPIKFELEIPASSGRTIKSVSKVAAGNNAINVATLDNGPNYLSAPISGGSTKVEFNTSLSEFREKRPAVPVAANGELAFIFLVVLDNDQEIVTTRVRVRLTN